MNFSPELNLVQQEYIRRITQGNAPILLEVEHFLASTPGKMIRPKLTLMSAATLAPTISQRTLLMAVAMRHADKVFAMHFLKNGFDVHVSVFELTQKGGKLVGQGFAGFDQGQT